MVQSVERAFGVLEALAGRPAGVTALATRLGLPKSTVARMLGTLEGLGAVERGDGSRYRLGPSVAALAAQVSPERSLMSAVRPALVDLVADLGEDAGLSLPDGYTVRYVDQVESDNPVQVRDWTGTRAPLHTAPSGLVLLASWPAEAIDAYLARDLERLTPHTVVDPAELRDRLEQVRADGYAWGHEEYAPGIASVAAPIRDSRGKPVAALHVHGPAYRFPATGRDEEIAARVARAADASSRLLER